MIPARRGIACSILAVAAWGASLAYAQISPKTYRIGIFLPFTADTIEAKKIPLQKPFEEGMRERGWVEGRNVEFFYRTVTGIDELVRLPVDVIVAFGGTHELAMRATRTVPIVAHFEDANLRAEAVQSLSRPGGNVTGITFEGQGGLGSKRLALLKEAAPIKRVARLYTNQPLRFGSDVGLLVGPLNRRPGLEPRWDALLELIARYRIPAIYDLPRAVDDGGMMGYGEDSAVPMRRLAYFVDRILRGAKPGDLPIEQGSQLEMVVNLKAAESIGLKIPQSVLLQADRIIR
jgi:putative ABC transport system substrate-binding protein